MQNKAQKIATKRLKRKRIVANKEENKRNLEKNFHLVVMGKKTKNVGKKKLRVIKPYRIMRVQHQIDKLEAGVRALPHSDQNRARLLKRLEEKRKLLGNQTYELSKQEKQNANQKETKSIGL